MTINPEFSLCRNCGNLTVATGDGRCDVCGTPKPVSRQHPPLQHPAHYRGVVKALQLAAFAVVVMLILLFIEWITKGAELR
jgi:ribosomal protein L37E